MTGTQIVYVKGQFQDDRYQQSQTLSDDSATPKLDLISESQDVLKTSDRLVSLSLSDSDPQNSILPLQILFSKRAFPDVDILKGNINHKYYNFDSVSVVNQECAFENSFGFVGGYFRGEGDVVGN